MRARHLIMAGVAATALSNSGHLNPMSLLGQSAAGQGDPWSTVDGKVGEIVSERSESDWRALQAGPEQARSRSISKLLDQAVVILQDSTALNERNEMRGILEKIRGEQDAVAKMRVQMLSAPDGSGFTDRIMYSVVGFIYPSKQTYESRISSAQDRIAELTAQTSSVKKRFRDDLAKIGIDLSSDQVDGLMRLATGEDIVEMQAVYENLRTINDRLLKATLGSDESLQVAKRYYGIYTVLLEIALRMHDKFIDKVDEEYVANLNKIIEQTKTLEAQANDMLAKQRDPRLRGVIQDNIKAQDLTLRTAGVYRDHLISERDQVAAARERVRGEHSIAVNTYQTVTVSSNLVGMLRESGKNFETLMQLQVPVLRPFANQEMQQEFDRLTAKIQAAPTS